MKKCSVVIGSLWGDEGKGHMTDLLCNEPNTLNVRFNGGAQASHTVVTPEGFRHAFRHFGSGTFSGAKTYLASQFIVNMEAFVLEAKKLEEEFLLYPTVFVNPDCIVTTPWDVYINQGIETMRKENRHGSCGFGINETVERSKYERYKITVYDLLFEYSLIEKLCIIRDEYVPERLEQEYGVIMSDLPQKYIDLMTNPEIIDMFIFFKNEFLKKVRVLGDNVLFTFDNVVFEGAQGLLLDKDKKIYYPHVTSSSTGIKTAIDILHKVNVNFSVDIYYMSRCYMTRHGAGPLINELTNVPYDRVRDLTNIPNEFQGSMRYSYLDIDLLLDAIYEDFYLIYKSFHLSHECDVNLNLVITCIDQLGKEFKYFKGKELNSVSSNKLRDVIWGELVNRFSKLKALYAMNGLTRNDFLLLKEC